MIRLNLHYWYVLRLMHVVYHWVNVRDEDAWPRVEKPWLVRKFKSSMPILVLFIAPVFLSLVFSYLSPWNPVIGKDEDGDLVRIEYYFPAVYWAALYFGFKMGKNPKFMPKDLRQLFLALDEAEKTLDGDSFMSPFGDVRAKLEDALILNPSAYIQAANETSAKQVIFVAIAKMSGGLAGSGDYHLYRGLLNPMGGSGLPTIHKRALAELTKLGVISTEDADGLKQELDANIASVG